MTLGETKKAVAAISAKVEATRTAYAQAEHAHYRIPGNYFDTPGPTLDAMRAAEKDFRAAIAEATALAATVPAKIGVVKVVDAGENSFVEFCSAADRRKAERENAAWSRWENSRY